MNLSDDSSSDEGEVPVPAKRNRFNSHGAISVLEESDGSPPPSLPYSSVHNYEADNVHPKSMHFHAADDNPEQYRQTSEENDDYRPSYGDNSADDETENIRFQKSKDNAFYNRKSDDTIYANTNTGIYSELSKKMMSNMGYKPGKGLGKYEHGRVEPVEASTQKGRRGLGTKPSVVGEVPKDFKWDQDQSTPEANEKVLWLPDNTKEPLQAHILEEWLRLGPKKLTIDDETNFVDPQILKGVLNSKTIFDNLQDEDMRKARFRSNPYETIGSVIFLNRAAVKMANIDAIFDFMFTMPKNKNGKLVVDQKDLLYFADVCAGPGGFSEYVLYRRGWRAKGFGFTLKGTNDFKLADFYAGTSETFIPYYGVNDDGNIFDPANLSSLKDFVLKQTDDVGVHFLMADGGFSVEGQENIQEILSKQLYLCQCLAALMLVRTGGNFVVKLFDVFTPFSVGLIYLMYNCFEKVCIHKPVTSRPANSERYLICLWKKSGVDAVERHLFSVNSKLWGNRGDYDDVVELVPLSVLCEDKPFFEYIYNSNYSLGEKQIKHLLKIAEFSKDPNLKDENQANMKRECLQLWKLPNCVRVQPKFQNAEETLQHMLDIMREANERAPDSVFTLKSNFTNKPPLYVEQMSDLDVFKNVYDWHFTFLTSTKASPDLRIFIGCGGKKVYQLDGSVWKNVADLHISMPAKTLIYGEVVKEFLGEGNTQLHRKALHVIDAMMLGGVDISHEQLTERVNQCAIFCKALEKHSEDSTTLPIRFKRFFNMESFSSAVTNLEYRSMKRIRQALTMNLPKRSQNSDMFFIVGSLLFIKELKDPWIAQISKSSGVKYYFGIGPDKKPRSDYFIPKEAKLDMISAYGARVMWPWGEYARAIFEGQINNRMTRLDMEEYIRKKL